MLFLKISKKRELHVDWSKKCRHSIYIAEDVYIRWPSRPQQSAYSNILLSSVRISISNTRRLRFKNQCQQHMVNNNMGIHSNSHYLTSHERFGIRFCAEKWYLCADHSTSSRLSKVHTIEVTEKCLRVLLRQLFQIGSMFSARSRWFWNCVTLFPEPFQIVLQCLWSL
jgi:hypothetical protein